MWNDLLPELMEGNVKALARCISLTENEVPGFQKFLEDLPVNTSAKIIGITGPPGAGKSTLTDALIGSFIEGGERVAVICVDPSSPFNLGALLGDRIRMSKWYNDPRVFIRSLASRGSLGGLNPKIIEISDVMKAAGFTKIIIETVGVGQSEIEIAGLADTTIVVLVPESGDEIQSMKSGLMEIADIFVVNKSDRPGADVFVKNIRNILQSSSHEKKSIDVIKTIASTGEGIEPLMKSINDKITSVNSERKHILLAEKAYNLIQKKRMMSVDKNEILAAVSKDNDFNLYKFVASF